MLINGQKHAETLKGRFWFITNTVSNEIGNFKVDSKNSQRFSPLEFFSMKLITTQVYLTR